MEQNLSGIEMVKNLFSSETEYFYNNFVGYDYREYINFTLALDSIYEAAMSLALADEQEKILLLQGKEITDSLNGTVVLCKDILKDGVHVIISHHPFLYSEPVTILGTIIHELTHANDFVDFAIKNETTESDIIMRNEYWHTLQMWSEFHARRNGFSRIIRILGEDSSSFDDDFIVGEINLLRERWMELKDENELYELMQLCGRYSVMEELFSNKVGGIEKDVLQHAYSGIKLNVCNLIYNFCKSHTTFDSFFEDKDDLRRLIT